MKPKKSVELKPCPFCGGKAMGAKINEIPPVFSVLCLGENCHASNEEEAIAAWNKRVKE